MGRPNCVRAAQKLQKRNEPESRRNADLFGGFLSRCSPVSQVNSFPQFWNVALAPLDQRDLFGHRAFMADAGDHLDPLVGL